jgi:cytochrome c oxidase subunit 4
VKHIATGLVFRVWCGLLALLALTVGTSFIPLGGINLALNLGIAGAKAAIVLIYFMHLGRGQRSTKLAAAAGVVWLLVLMVLSLSDFLWRGN